MIMGDVVSIGRGGSHWLILCDPRSAATHASPGGTQEIAPKLRRLLMHARAREWCIVHVVRRGGEGLGPAPGLAALCSEPVFAMLPRASPFTHDSLRERALRSRRATFFVAGFDFSDAVLSTLIVGNEYGLNMCLVEDAVANDRSDVDISYPTRRAIASRHAAVVTVDELDRFTSRETYGGM